MSLSGGSSSPSSTPSPSLGRGSLVHIIWDLSCVHVPAFVSCLFVLQRLVSLAEEYGVVASFHAYTSVDSDVSASLKQSLQHAGVTVEDVINKKPQCVDVSVLTRLLTLCLSCQQHAASSASSLRQPANANAPPPGPPHLPVLIILSHDRDLAPAFHCIRRAGLFAELVVIYEQTNAIIHSATKAIHWYSLLGIAGYEQQGRQPPTMIEPQENIVIMKDNTTAMTARGVETADSEGLLPGYPSYGYLSASRLSGGMSSPSPPPSAAGSVPGSRGFMSPNRIHNALHAFNAILTYCEKEKIIPRESVLKKRLLDGHFSMDLAADFEEFLSVVVNSGSGVVEGEAPQRIIWPREADSDGARRFACADFFQPTQRLSADQSRELLAFLFRYKPEVDRGRFGFAQYLSRHGPRFIQLLPHGVLVELVQLLLNQKVLVFRKGRVSVAPSAPPTSSLTDLTLTTAASAGYSSSCPSSPATRRQDEQYYVQHPSNGTRPRFGSVPSSVPVHHHGEALYPATTNGIAYLQASSVVNSSDSPDSKRTMEMHKRTMTSASGLNVAALGSTTPARSSAASPASFLLQPMPGPSSLMRVPSVTPPSDRAFIPPSVVPYGTEFNAVDLLYKLTNQSRQVPVGFPLHTQQSVPAHHYPTHLPLYHYEQSINTTDSETMWVAVCTLSLHCSSPTHHLPQPRHYKSTQQKSMYAAKQESARRALQESLWSLVFGACLLELRQRVASRHNYHTDEGEESVTHAEQQRLLHNELNALASADSVAEVDRLLAFFDQPAINYQMESTVIQNSRGARTLWKCTGMIQFIASEQQQGPEGTSCSLLSSSQYLLLAGYDQKLHPMPRQPFVSQAAQARKTDAKTLVASQLLQKLAIVVSRSHNPPSLHSAHHYSAQLGHPARAEEFAAWTRPAGADKPIIQRQPRGFVSTLSAPSMCLSAQAPEFKPIATNITATAKTAAVGPSPGFVSSISIQARRSMFGYTNTQQLDPQRPAIWNHATHGPPSSILYTTQSPAAAEKEPQKEDQDPTTAANQGEASAVDQQSITDVTVTASPATTATSVFSAGVVCSVSADDKQQPEPSSSASSLLTSATQTEGTCSSARELATGSAPIPEPKTQLPASETGKQEQPQQVDERRDTDDEREATIDQRYREFDSQELFLSPSFSSYPLPASLFLDDDQHTTTHTRQEKHSYCLI